jgi:hypothetical protein
LGAFADHRFHVLPQMGHVNLQEGELPFHNANPFHVVIFNPLYHGPGRYAT